jgi:hypothetical protein
VESAGSFDEGNARRLFLDEARRRVLRLLEELHYWKQRHRRSPPPWTYERIAALADQVTGDDIPTSLLDESIAATEADLERTLSEITALIVETPIPYVPTEPATVAPSPRRHLLTIMRGGRA